MFQKGPIRFTYQARSDPGRVRQNNEDALIEAAELGLFGVCDGLGGHAAGEIASSIASDTLKEFAQDASISPEEVLTRGIDEANYRILENQTDNPQYQGMGTTVSALWLVSPSIWIAHVGDSRIYLKREREFQQITEDHSPVFRLFKQGVLSKDQMQRHPQKNLLDRSLGIVSDIEADVFPLSIEQEDLFLICTDGLTDMLTDAEILAILNGPTMSEATDQLVEQANANGGLDNITVMLVKILEIER